MDCLRCKLPGQSASAPCVHCGFTGPPGMVEELSHVRYLLGELPSWSWLGHGVLSQVRTHYQRRGEELEAALGLRAPRLSAEEVRERQWELRCLSEYLEETDRWNNRAWLRAGVVISLRWGPRERIQAIGEELDADPAGAPRAPAFDSLQDRLKLLSYLEERLGRAHDAGSFVSDKAHAAALADLQSRRYELEVRAGLRRPMVIKPASVKPEPVVAPAARRMAARPEAVVEVPPVRPSRPPRPPREPITWERIGQTLLSERTLHAVLGLGAFLLVASAVTFLIYNWDKLPDVAQLAVIVLVTLAFYAAGWYLRVRLKLRASGIAVTAVGSLLVPLDIYGVLILGGVWPAGAWPWAWLLASAVCLPLYTHTTLRLRATFFGYTVTVAAGSLLCAGLRVLGVQADWWLLALTALALAATFLAGRVSAAKGNWAILADPLRISALVAASVILLGGLGWWIAEGMEGAALSASVAGAWTLGACLYAWSAWRQRNPMLGRAAATALPIAVLLLLLLVFYPLEVPAPWYALGWALLAPLYLWAGRHTYTLSSRSTAAPVKAPLDEGGEPADQGAGESGLAVAETASENLDDAAADAKGREVPAFDRVLRAHSHTATGWGLALMAGAAVWALFDPWAATATHGVLVAVVAQAVWLWDRPRALPVASLLALTATAFGLTAAHFHPAEVGFAWALLAALHIAVAVLLRSAPRHTAWLYGSTFAVAGLGFLPPLIYADELVLTYVLGIWIAVAAALAWLDRTGKQPGLAALLAHTGRLRPSVLYWLISVPIPLLTALITTRFRAPDAWLGLLIAGVAWVFFVAGQLRHVPTRGWSFLVQSAPYDYFHWSFPWTAVAYACSLAAPVLARFYYHQPLLAVTVLAASILYFASAWAFRQRAWFLLAGLSLPAGLLILLDFWKLPWSQQSLILALIPAAYLLGGTALERWRGQPRAFLSPLYVMAHVTAAVAVAWGLWPAAERWSNGSVWLGVQRLWAAGGHLILVAAYGLFAWFRSQERWAHVGAWLGVLAGAVLIPVVDVGGLSWAFQVAMMAAVYVLAERAVAGRLLGQRWPAAGQVWSLFRRPLLVAGWASSAAAVCLAVVENLVVLEGTRLPAAWAVAALLAVTMLYALAAGMFRRRLFLWLAGLLIIVPWTLQTHWAWFLWHAPPALPRYALSWAILACLQLATASLLCFRPTRRRPPFLSLEGKGETPGWRYGFPLRVVANVLLPLSLFWAVADSTTSSITWGLAVVFYVSSAVMDHLRGIKGWRGARFLYPAVAVLPVWAIHLLRAIAPAVPYEAYGLLLLALTLPLLGIGLLLRRVDPADAMPLYLGTYAVAIVGTLLVAHQRPYFSGALGFDVLLCVLSAWIFRQPVWGYPAAALAPAALLVILPESSIPPDRRGWCLIGLAAIYLALAWVLRWLKQERYATAPLALAFVVVVLGLPPSSLDEVGAFWGYLAAALIYAVAAAWLRQPLMLVATALLSVVPYGVGLVWTKLEPAYYGLGIFPGVVVALGLAHVLDWRPGRAPVLEDSRQPWTRRLGSVLNWWAAPWYVWAYGGALVAVGLSLSLQTGQAWADATRVSITLGLAAVAFLHATWRFRLRGALIPAGVLAQGAILAIIDGAGWLDKPSWAALAFLPVTVITAGLAVGIELWRREGSPLGPAWFKGWSRPLYLLLAADLLGGQIAGFFHSEPGTVVTAVHALLLAFLGTAWSQPVLPYFAAALGLAGVIQGLAWAGAAQTAYPVATALVALAYGLVGNGIQFARVRARQACIWIRPLAWGGLALSAAALLAALIYGGGALGQVARALSDPEVTIGDYAAQARMLMWVLALCGLLTLATALVRRLWVLSYGAVALVLAAWAIWWRFFIRLHNAQWYAVPVGLYLLAVGWLEWRQGRKRVARWVDGAGILVWLGTAWWQSFPGVMEDGWPFALIMGAEALLLMWWGSARRLKLFLSVGLVSVVLDAITQSIPPLLSANRWIVFGVAGTLLVGLAILVERRLEKIRELSAELRVRFEAWE